MADKLGLKHIKQYYLNTRPEIAPFLPSHFANTLEIGCATGGFSERFLSASASETWGVEPDPHVATLAAPKFSRLLCGSYDQKSAEIPDRYFDLIVCNDVIEHMLDHDRFLQDVAKKLEPGGYLVGSIPNVRYITALFKLLILKDWPYADEGIFDRTHLRFFTDKSLRRAFVANGFAIEQINGVRSILLEGCNGPLVVDFAARIATAAIIGASFGYWSDVQYMQVGFRVRLK